MTNGAAVTLVVAVPHFPILKFNDLAASSVGL